MKLLETRIKHRVCIDRQLKAEVKLEVERWTDRGRGVLLPGTPASDDMALWGHSSFCFQTREFLFVLEGDYAEETRGSGHICAGKKKKKKVWRGDWISDSAVACL